MPGQGMKGRGELARRLGMSERTLYRRLKFMGLIADDLAINCRAVHGSLDEPPHRMRRLSALVVQCPAP